MNSTSMDSLASSIQCASSIAYTAGVFALERGRFQQRAQTSLARVGGDSWQGDLRVADTEQVIK